MVIIKDFIKTTGSLFSALWDLFVLKFPHVKKDNSFAFLVHPRDITDIYRPFPFFKYLPDALVFHLVKFLPPITLSSITGLVSVKTGEPIKGYLLSIVLTPQHMENKLQFVLKRTRQMALLAKKKGVRIIGLGALLPSITRHGHTFRYEVGGAKEPPYITTGHAYTAYTIIEYLKELISKRNSDWDNVTVAIVGAAGSTGSLCAKIIASSDLKISLILLDLEIKKKSLQKNHDILTQTQNNDHIKFSISTDLMDLRNVDYVITVTNASSAIIEPKHIRSGTVIIDDSQPRNTTPELIRHGVWIIDVLAKVPGLNCNFDFGFLNKDSSLVFTCLAETAILASVEREGDFSIGYVNIELIDELEHLVKRTFIEKASFHSFTKALTVEEVEKLLTPLPMPKKSTVLSGI